MGGCANPNFTDQFTNDNTNVGNLVLEVPISALQDILNNHFKVQSCNHAAVKSLEVYLRVDVIRDIDPMPMPELFWEGTITSQQYNFNNTSSIQRTIDVPEDGPYLLSAVFTYDCIDCCGPSTDIQMVEGCDQVTGLLEHEDGLRVLEYMDEFPADDRPPFNQNYFFNTALSTSMYPWIIYECDNCGC
jgi:hypothetical protein